MNRPLRFSSVPELHWPPGSTLGLMGGGQLGRMMAMAAARMGYRTHVFTDQQHTPAGEVAAAVTVASFSDRAALERFANSVQVVTYEFENVPLAAAKIVAERVAVRPGPNVLAIAQDRLAEKDFLSKAALPVAPYQGIATPEELQLATEVGFPAVLKTRREGYDGKGQVRVKSAHDLSAAWERLGHVPVVLERWIDFACEVSVIIARSQDGEEVAYEPAENRHAGGILRTSIVPALISQGHGGRRGFGGSHGGPRAGLRRRACRGDVRVGGRRRRCQRNCPAAAQLRTLDDRCGGDQSVRGSRSGCAADSPRAAWPGCTMR